MYSLRRTLAVRFSLTLFGALLLIALWAYMGAQRLLREELDRGLHAAAGLELSFIRAGFPLHPYPEALALDDFVSQLNRFVVIRTYPGSITATNTALASDIPMDRAAYEQAVAGSTSWTTQVWHDQPIRSLYMPVSASQAPPAVIQVAASMVPLQHAGRELLLVMMGTVLLGVVATAIGAYWLAGSSVAPVVAIAEQAAAIDAGTTGKRISAHADVAELRSLIDVLNRMLARLDAAFASQRRMIADAGHDLRTPLTAMRGELEVALRTERPSETYRSILASQLEEVDHLIAISNSLVLLARLDAGELRPTTQRVDLVAVAHDAVQRSRSRAGARTVELEGAETVKAIVDESMIAIVLDHLLHNGVTHTPDASRIVVRVDAVGTNAHVSVADDGPGLPPEVMDHMFDRFYRSDAARTRSGGAGLGLAISAAIVEAHGGTITAARGDHGGLTITLVLPRE